MTRILATSYQREFKDGSHGANVSQGSGYSAEDIARIAVISFADKDVLCIRFRTAEGYLYIDRAIASVVGPGLPRRTRHRPADTRCHSPYCIAQGRCVYGNEVAEPPELDVKVEYRALAERVRTIRAHFSDPEKYTPTPDEAAVIFLLDCAIREADRVDRKIA